jgi:Na+-driven multidrug efflux pump
MAGAGVAVVLTSALTAAVLAAYLFSRHSLLRPKLTRLSGALFFDILRVGAVGALSTLQTTLTVALTTAIVAVAGGTDAVAGYGTGARLEYLLIPLVFGLGAPLVALVGTNIGAGQQKRALRIALTGGALAFGMTEAIGLAAAAWPQAWLGMFGDDPRMLATARRTASSDLACAFTLPPKEPAASSGPSSLVFCAYSSPSWAASSSCA